MRPDPDCGMLPAGLGRRRDDLLKTVSGPPLEQLALPWDALTDTKEPCVPGR